MPSQRSLRYPLRSHDLPMGSDLFASHKNSTSPQSQMLDGGSKSIMPSIIDRSQHTVINYHHNGNTYADDGPFASPKTLFDWQDFNDPALLFQDIDHSRMSHHCSEAQFEGTFGVSTAETSIDHNVWDFGALQSPPDLACSSSIYPRACSLREDTSAKDLIQSKLQSFPPSSDLMEPQHRQFHQTHSQFQRATPNGLPTSPREILSSRLKDRSYHSELSLLEDVKVESPDSDSPGTVKGQADDSSPRTLNNDESDADSSVTAEPYAQLIFRALKSVPGHGMVLKEIYDWFEKNTDKARNTSSKGWQNSIRHNLSMNGAFKKVEQGTPTEESKKGFIWVLEQSALEVGVKSTTRYRKVSSNKKPSKSETPAPQRQRSGSKGGKAARKAAKSRRSVRFDELRNFQYHERLPIDSRTATTSNDHDYSTNTFFSPGRMPYYLQTPHPPNTPLIPEDISYTLSDITGCASGAPNDPLFYETLDAGIDSMLSCHSFCGSEDTLLTCGLGCVD